MLEYLAQLHEDVTDIDSVGIVTARSGIKVGAHAGVGLTIFSDGSINSSGIITASNVSVASSVTAATFHGNGVNLTGFKSGVLERVCGQCDGFYSKLLLWDIYFSNCNCRTKN